ncbi:type I methionyl aminopeptidase [Microbacterium gorillae]|uniref:type I methionyl aminopeptidase n=1 Tax=Microbacterium gorillae TaxID=1231063 RepID=UPI000590A965|nr:type I methionyl aminopeptidase [Microbacterium gorillae]
MVFGRGIYKNPAQLRGMIEPGLITAAMLDAVQAMIAPGVTTADLDAEAERVMRERGAKSNFQMVRGYRHTVCASVNDQVVHGIPGSRVLEPGDIVKIDAGAELAGWNGDSARTFVIPDPSRPQLVAEREELSRVTEGSMWAGLAAIASATHVDDISTAIEAYLLQHRLAHGRPAGILREYVGHGIGRKMHEAPSVFNYHTSARGAEIKPGLCLAIEPMTTTGGDETYVEDDDWTVTTVDGSWGSHWEHSVAVHARGIWVLTAADGGAAGLAPFGVTPTPIP